jgi:RNA polymerase sigma-70 factor, ECF subfamily
MELVAEHRSAMEARAKQLCHSNFDADDLVQDALERAFRTRNPSTDPARTRGWLLRIQTNIFIDWVRKRRRLPAHVELDDNVLAPAASERTMWEDVSPDDLCSATDRLPDDTRETYRLFTVEGLSHAEIATAQRIPVRTVATRVHRARKQLKALLMAMYRKKRGPADKGSK